MFLVNLSRTLARPLLPFFCSTSAARQCPQVAQDLIDPSCRHFSRKGDSLQKFFPNFFQYFFQEDHKTIIRLLDLFDAFSRSTLLPPFHPWSFFSTAQRCNSVSHGRVVLASYFLLHSYGHMAPRRRPPEKHMRLFVTRSQKNKGRRCLHPESRLHIPE